MDLFERFKKNATDPNEADPLYGLTLNEIINGVLAWRGDLVKYLIDKPTDMDMSHVSDCQSCKIGLWLEHADHSEYENTNEFNHFKEMHLIFHNKAAEVVSLYDAGQDREAKKILHGAFTKTAREMQIAITSLYEIIKNP